MRRLILPLLLTAAVTLTVPAVAQSRVRLTAGRMKHQIFHVLRHSADFGYLYDEGRIHGPVYKICWNWTRTWGGCAFELGIGPRLWCGSGSVRIFRRRGGRLWLSTRIDYVEPGRC